MSHRASSTEFQAQMAAIAKVKMLSVLLLTTCFVSSLVGCAAQSGGGYGASTPAKAPSKLVKSTLESSVSREISPLTLNSVLVYPLEAPLGGATEVSAGSLELATNGLIEKLQVGTSVQVINSDPAKDVSQAIAKTRGIALPLRERAIQAARGVDAQGVLYGVLSRFTDAVGSRLGETGRSEVSFQMWLVDVRSGGVVWQATFNDSNKPLSENLFRLGHVAHDRFQYMSAEQILAEGLGLATADLEQARKKQS